MLCMSLQPPNNTCFAWLQVREQQGVARDEYTYSATIAAAGKAGDLAAAQQAFTEAAAARLANSAVCNAAIEALSRAGDTEVTSM